LHASTPDLVEVDALLSAYSDEPEFALIEDYFVAQVEQCVSSGHPHRWRLAMLRHVHTPTHANTPPLTAMAEQLDRMAQVTELGVLNWIALLLRQHIPIRRGAATWLAQAMVAPDTDITAEAIALTATTALADCYSSTRPEAIPTAQAICAVVRGIEAWCARQHLHRLLGPDQLPSNLRHKAVFGAMSQHLHTHGEPWLVDRARHGWVAMRDVRYSPIEDFARVMSAAASVAELTLHRDAWPTDRRHHLHTRWIAEAQTVLARCGVHIDPHHTEASLDPGASLQGHDGTLALQVTLASLESLHAGWGQHVAQHLARQLLGAIDALAAPSDYRRWALKLC
ncbi:MAG: hypothetical protein AAFS10_27965, partial [Myxococcota bacterium]